MVMFQGGVRTYDAVDPLSWPAATAAAPWLIRAGTRFTFKNARFFAGYAVDAGRVPLSWSPPGRLFARVTPETGWVLDEAGEVVESWGVVDTVPGARFRRSFHGLPRARGVDLGVPAKVRRDLGVSGPGALALDAVTGSASPITLPVRWRRVAAEGVFDVAVPRGLSELTGAGPESAAALAVDHASAWRASDMSGMLIRGTGALYAPGETRKGVAELHERIRLAGIRPDAVPDTVLVRLRPSQVVWWRGWFSATVAAR
jgi:hypothetical protein